MHFLTRGIAVAALLALPHERPITVPHVRSGHAELRQQGRLTVLELAGPNKPLQRIALTHPSENVQTMYAPYEARLIAESPNHFLIFTDTFESNPGNVQGECGADPTGERFVHVIALGAIPHETLSVLVESCLLDLEPTAASPEWEAKPDSAGFVGRLILRFESGMQPTAVYYVSDDGSVSRPEVGANP